MKNIHLIPTEKPSRLYLVKSNNKLDITSNNPEYTENFGSGTQNQHIYITSDEEIKQGDWCYQVELNDGKVDKCYDITLYHTWTNNGVDKTRKFKKIILTTDQDLIKYGVQAIDDEFLEWFVKNPSYEEVEVKFIKDGWCLKEAKEVSFYKTIIPRTTQQIIDEDFDGGLTMGQIIPKEEAKQVGEYQQELFNYLHDLGVIALQSEMQEIERIVLNMQQEQDKKLYSDLVDLLERLRPIYKEDSVSHFKCEKQRINIIEQFKNK